MRRKGVKKKTVYIVAAVAVALMIAGLAVKIMMKKGVLKPTDNNDSVRVYVLATKVSADDTLQPDMLREVEVAADLVPDNPFMSFADEGSEKFRISLQGGIILTNDMLYTRESEGDDVRLHNFPYVELSDKIETGEYVDIRISFPNGCDYIVLSRKKVMDFTYEDEEEGLSNALWLDVDEEEILRMSGAVVDCSLSEGSRIYAIKYKDGAQKAAIVNYPVSAVIEALIENDPNIVEKAAEAVSEKKDLERMRKELIENIDSKNQEDVTGKEEKNGNSSQEDNSVEVMETDDNLEVYEKPAEDEIVYLG